MLLALDLGTLCGWSLWRGSERVSSGHWKFESKPATKSRPACERFTSFRLTVLQLVIAHEVKTIAYDRVRVGGRASAVSAAPIVFGGWVACLCMVAHETGAVLVECSSHEVTKAAGVKRLTSKIEPDPAKRRAATKAALVEAARARGWPVETDDEAEACFIGLVVTKRG